MMDRSMDMNSVAVTAKTSLPRFLSPKTWTLALVQGTFAVSVAVMAALPHYVTTLPVVCATCGGLLGLVAVVLVLLGSRVGDGALLALATATVLVAGLIMAVGHGEQAGLLAGFGLVWVGIWATGFFRSRVVTLTYLLELGVICAATGLNPQHLRVLAESLPVLATSVVLSVLLSQMLANLRHEARHDQLTGLLNRRGLDQAAAEILDGRRGAGAASLVVIDVDGLKQVNDQRGHVAGDRLLAGFATELQTAARAVDLVARVGGDEFVAVLPGLTAADAEGWAAGLRGQSASVWSFGVAERREGERLGSWLDRADKRMYAAKAQAQAGAAQLVPVLAG